MADITDNDYDTGIGFNATIGVPPVYRYFEALSIFTQDKCYTLSPKEDITAFELWNLHVILEECKLNRYSSSVDKVIDRIKELGVLRHFEVEEK